MEKRVLFTELDDRGSHLRKEITPTAVVTDKRRFPTGQFWDANKTYDVIVADATSASDTLEKAEKNLNNEIARATNAETAISNRIDDLLGIDAQDIEDLKQIVEDLDPETGILSVIDSKTDKVENATSGNFASLDSNGNLVDSGHSHSDYLTQHQDLTNYVQKSETAGLLKNDGTVDTNTYLTQHQDISGKANISDISAPAMNANGHNYVDLGLPSNTLWATMNIGASDEYNYGSYYMYGKTTTYNSSDSTYTGTENPLSLSADAARQIWGGDWYIPTKADFEELIANTTYYKDSSNGITYIKFTSKNNGNEIIIPCGGQYLNGNNDQVGQYCYYWTSTIGSNKPYFLYSLSSSLYVMQGSAGTDKRDNGFNVRPVIKGPAKILGTTITAAERTAWNAKADASNVYTKAEIDQMLQQLANNN